MSYFVGKSGTKHSYEGLGRRVISEHPGDGSDFGFWLAEED
jgi:hypothetical protein